MLYEIISPDAFLRPFIDSYKTLTQIYFIVRNAFANRIYVDKEFQRKTVELVKENVDINIVGTGTEFIGLDKETIEAIKENKAPENVKVINLVKSIDKIAEKESSDLVLISLKEKAHQIQEDYEDRIKSGIENSDETAKKFKTAFSEFPNWSKSEASVRDLRLKLYGILLDEMEDIDKANSLIDHLFNLFIKANEKN
jgi:type I restriction enzyme R subunit